MEAARLYWIPKGGEGGLIWSSTRRRTRRRQLFVWLDSCDDTQHSVGLSDRWSALWNAPQAAQSKDRPTNRRAREGGGSDPPTGHFSCHVEPKLITWHLPCFLETNPGGYNARLNFNCEKNCMEKTDVCLKAL